MSGDRYGMAVSEPLSTDSSVRTPPRRETRARGFRVARTLRARLLLSLLAVLVVAAAAMGSSVYWSVLKQTESLFDYQLRQMALSLRDQGYVAPEDARALADGQLDFVIQIWREDGREVYASRREVEPPPRGTTLELDAADGGAATIAHGGAEVSALARNLTTTPCATRPTAAAWPCASTWPRAPPSCRSTTTGPASRPRIATASSTALSAARTPRARPAPASASPSCARSRGTRGRR